MFEVKRHVVVLGGGKYLAGFAVIKDSSLVEWFRTKSEATYYAERQEEELTRDG